jgi:methyl-accepting chemotaxis protein
MTLRSTKLLETDNPIGEDLKHVAYLLNSMADEIARVSRFLPAKNKDEMDGLVKITIQMKSKLGTAMGDLNESIQNIVSVAEEIELAKLNLNKENNQD